MGFFSKLASALGEAFDGSESTDKAFKATRALKRFAQTGNPTGVCNRLGWDPRQDPIDFLLELLGEGIPKCRVLVGRVVRVERLASEDYKKAQAYLYLSIGLRRARLTRKQRNWLQRIEQDMKRMDARSLLQVLGPLDGLAEGVRTGGAWWWAPAYHRSFLY